MIFIIVHFYVYYHWNNTLESRLYLFLQDMHELIQVNNGLYWIYIYTYIYIYIYCNAQPCCALLGYSFHNTAAHTKATPTRQGI